MKLKKIVPNIEKTFGKLLFINRGRNVFECDPISGKYTEKLKFRTYNLVSEVQGREVQVFVPAEVEELHFNFRDEMEIINPKLKVCVSSSEKGDFEETEEEDFEETVCEFVCEVDTIQKKRFN